MATRHIIKDNILSIEIDVSGKLHVKPEKTRFNMIYRTATEVHWDNKKMTLYSPKPIEWSYLNWFKHISKVAESEYLVKLELTDNTDWVNIPKKLKNEIMLLYSK